MSIKVVVFDFDGTLTMPGAIDFVAVRSQIGCPEGKPMFEFIKELPSKKQKVKAYSILEAYELQGALRSVPDFYVEEVLMWLVRRKKKIAILTRNTGKAILTALNNFRQIKQEFFDIIVTREISPSLKPEPDGVELIARKLAVKPSEMLVVGDYIYDVEAGRKAGALTAFIISQYTKKYPNPPADFTIKSLNELCTIVEKLENE